VSARLKIIWQAAEKFAADDGWAIASYIGLTLLTSLFPFLIFVAAVAGFFGSSDLAHEAAKLVFAEWPEVVARPISEEVERVLTTPRSGGLLTFGAVFSFYFASSAIEALRVGLNRAYGLIEPRPWWMLRLQSLGLVLIGSIALLALAFLVVLGPLIVDTLGAFFPSVEQAHPLLTFLRIGIAGLMLASSLILAHIILPAHRVGFRDILPGVALTFVASIAFGELFGAYLSEYLRNYISTYAGLASVMIALVYLYWVALLFVFGGELNAATSREHTVVYTRVPEHRVDVALELMGDMVRNSNLRTMLTYLFFLTPYEIYQMTPICVLVGVLLTLGVMSYTGQTPWERHPDGDELLLALDGVQDPHNLGACLRSADACGALAVIVPRDRAAQVTPTVRKVAVGAAETTPVVAVTNLVRTLKLLKHAGLWVVGADAAADQSAHQRNHEKPGGPPVKLLLYPAIEALAELVFQSSHWHRQRDWQGSGIVLDIAVVNDQSLQFSLAQCKAEAAPQV